LTALAPTDRFQPKGDRSEAAKTRVLVAAVEWCDDQACAERLAELEDAVAALIGQDALASSSPDQSLTLTQEPRA